MILNLRELDSFPAHVILEGDPGKIIPDFEGIVGVQKVSAVLDIQKSGEEYFCQGEIDATVRLECARCLSEFESELRNTTDFIVCSESLYAERIREGIDYEDYTFFQGADLQADLTAIVRQTIILAVGLKPLCSESCRGLCPHCGVNLNEQTCGCAAKHIDPRWEQLKKFRNGLMKGE
jgi:uncharacterized protein